jgi:hypothetical protein
MRYRPGLFALCHGLLIGALALPLDAAACSISQFEMAEQTDLPRYTVVLFYKPGTPANDASLAALRDLSKRWVKLANVDFEAVDASSERGAKIARYWQVKEFPVTYVIAPTGWCLATVKGKLTASDVEPLMSSPGKAALRKELASHKAAFLILGKKGMKGFPEAVKQAAAATKVVKEAMKIEVGTVVVDPTDAREAKLLQNLGLDKAPEEARVFVTFGKGRAVLQELEAETLEERLAFTIQLLSTADQCSLGAEIQGEPLLLGRAPVPGPETK